jgi:hypothetical protein
MITKHTINAYKNGQIKSAHLITSRYPHRPGTVVHQLAMVKDGQVLYTYKLTQGISADKIKVEVDSQTWYVSDITPTIVIASNIAYDPQPYNDPYKINSLSMDMNVSINNQIELQYRANYLSTWHTLMTLPADATDASLDYTVRIESLRWRIKIGSWTNEFNQYAGNDSTTRQIPEAQWGV